MINVEYSKKLNEMLKLLQETKQTLDQAMRIIKEKDEVIAVLEDSLKLTERLRIIDKQIYEARSNRSGI